MTPTSEQLAIIEAAKTTRSNLLLNALAGAAKTTTLEMIVKALPVGPILSLAFNKRIADEMGKRLPGHVNCATLNSVGHRAWAATCGRKRLVVEGSKTRNLVKEIIKDGNKELWDWYSDIVSAVGAAKRTGYIPPGMFRPAVPLISREDFYASLDEELSRAAEAAVDEAVIRSIRAAYDGLIDYDDQLYMPTLFGGAFPRFPLVMVDEAQDLSSINHAMLRKLVTQRLIAVGDPWQSIYGFRGAVTGGMASLKQDFGMEEYSLSVTFRCPRAIVERARSRVPHYQWVRDGGTVEELDQWSVDSIPDGAAIICRNNAPLMGLAWRLLESRRGVDLVGRDLGPQLINALKRLGPPSTQQEKVYDLIDQWRAEKARKSRDPSSLEDRAECLRVFAGFGQTLGDAVAATEHLFASRGTIQLLSGHKAKGLEWDTVYHLDPWRIPGKFAKSHEDREQELNVRYVIETRAREALYLVNSETLQHG